MKVVLNSKKLEDLSTSDMAALDAKLQQVNGLAGWSYSPLTGELVLDFGIAEEEALTQKATDALGEITEDYPNAQIKSVIVWELCKEWSS